MAEKVIKIALVDDHTLFRTGLRGLLSGREDFSVVADFGSGVEFLKQLPELDVDVVFMDIAMPEMDGAVWRFGFLAQGLGYRGGLCCCGCCYGWR